MTDIAIRKALAHELTLRGIRFEQFKKLPVYYKGILVGEYEADPSARLRTCFVIEGKINPSISSGQRFGAESLQQKRIVR